MAVRSLTSLLILPFVLIAAALPASAEDPRTATVQWVAGAEEGAASLVLRFDRPAAGIEARMTGSGFELVLDNASVTATGLPEGVKAFRDGGATRLRIDRPGLIVRSVRLDGATATVAVIVPPQASPTTAYSVGVGDVLGVSVYGNPDLSGEFIVAPDGTIAVPLVGPLPVAGRTESAITGELTKRLAADFLVDPQVSVSVKTYQSQFVYVTGAVPRSSRVAIRSGLTLRGALAEAGAAISPGMTVELRRASGDASILDAAALDSSGAPLPKDGDVLAVQQSNFVSIYGEVRRSSRLALTPDMTLLQAIAMAEGLTDWANKKKVKILRKGPGGTEELSVNLGAVEKHQISDPPLKPEDVIIVGRRFL